MTRSRTALSQREDRDMPGGDLLTRLGGDGYDGYLRQPFPSGSDEGPQAVVRVYMEAEPQVRTVILDQVDENSAEILEIFGERQAVVAVRSRSVGPIRTGLVALGMAIPRSDYRYALMGLSKLDHSARLLGADLGDLVENVSPFLPGASRTFIDQFLERDDRGPSLIRGMGYEAYGSGEEFIYDNASPYDDVDE